MNSLIKMKCKKIILGYFKENINVLSVCSYSRFKNNPPEKIDKSRFPNIKYTTRLQQITSTLKKRR